MIPVKLTGRRLRIQAAGKNRIIDVITSNDGRMFEAVYKKFYINIIYTKPDHKPFYAYVIHPDGAYIVDGWFNGGSFEAIVQMCLENIFTK